jgi:choline dehydrogenase-like flavoprotein
MYQFIGPSFLNFATRTFDDGLTIGESSADVIVNASLLYIGREGRRVTGLRVASMDTGLTPHQATEFTIKADVYVLACGAVANARQLLLSDLGNEHDLVGRYFMAHALTNPGVVDQTPYLNDSQTRFMGGNVPQGGPWTDENGVRVNARFIPDAEITRNNGIGRCWFWYQYGQYYFEQAPNPESRVTLADSIDPVFGQRQTRIDWQLSPTDQKTYETTTSMFQNSISLLGGGMFITPWDEVESQLVVNGHHMGTTRMADKPEDGVVDANLRVHSLDNLYVAGSSVFPNAGISNPTFTIITLSIRLAEHLVARLRA